MAKFAIYYIPPADSDLYCTGTQLLGYDIRAGIELPADTPARQRFPAFTRAWVDLSARYGFHMTVAGTYEYDPATLRMDEVITACDRIMGCFDPAQPMHLTQHPTEFLWTSGFVGLRYEPNLAFQTAHTVLCTDLPRFGVNSRSLRRLTSQPDYYDSQPHLAARTRHFFTPYIFDNFMPHFTLFNPFPQSLDDAARAALLDLTGSITTVTVESLCLVRLRDDADRYELVHEFHRRDYTAG